MVVVLCFGKALRMRSMKKLIIALIFFGNFSVFSQTIAELPDVTKLYIGERDGELITRNYIDQIALTLYHRYLRLFLKANKILKKDHVLNHHHYV